MVKSQVFFQMNRLKRDLWWLWRISISISTIISSRKAVVEGSCPNAHCQKSMSVTILMSTAWRTLVVWCLSYPSGGASLSRALRFFGSLGGLILEPVNPRMQASPQTSWTVFTQRVGHKLGGHKLGRQQPRTISWGAVFFILTYFLDFPGLIICFVISHYFFERSRQSTQIHIHAQHDLSLVSSSNDSMKRLGPICSSWRIPTPRMHLWRAAASSSEGKIPGAWKLLILLSW